MGCILKYFGVNIHNELLNDTKELYY